MQLRCKVGDLAVVVSGYFPENLGAIVEVKEGPMFTKDTGLPYWLVVSTGRLLKYARIPSMSTAYSPEGFALDKGLLPIRPGGEDKEVVEGLYSFMPDFVPEPALYLD